MQRTIKSFVLRAGRVSPRQQLGLDEYLSHYQLPPPNELWDISGAFDCEAPVIVEIGFGMGASLVSMAKARPDINFIGIEVHQAGIGALAADIYEQQITNIRIAPYDAVTVFKFALSFASLAGVQIFFPDPWPKKRHHKRRLVQREFIQLISDKLKSGGVLHCATDWQDYAEHMMTVLSAEPSLTNQAGLGQFSPRPSTRPLTKFELRGTRLGHGVWDLLFVREV